ncbi:GNAT family N-acetyltransferase [Streptomyces sp. NPDC005485]|uniref:GNAT family N-acetyltransferase n=1 Tax=Streptomyces sp. NPDC005485 TaxID=3155591 RepID=UPI0033A0E35D
MTDGEDTDDKPLTLPTHELHGHGLRLRRWDPESDADVEAWLRGCLDPEFQRWNTPLKPMGDFDGVRDALRARFREDMTGSGASFRITDAATGEILGHVGINDINPAVRLAHIGYWVLPESRGRRVATRALTLAARFALTDLGLNRLELNAVGHHVSCRVAEGCGFRYEGTRRGAMFEAGRSDAFRDAHLHARIAGDAEPAVERGGGDRPSSP